MKAIQWRILMYAVTAGTMLTAEAGYAQSVDSLSAKLRLAHSVSEKIEIVTQIIPLADSNDNMHEKVYYLNLLDSLAHASLNVGERVNTYLNLGTLYRNISFFEIADVKYEEALMEAELLEKHVAEEMKARIYASQGQNKISLTDFVKASELLTQALAYFERNKSYDELIRTYSALVVLYQAERVHVSREHLDDVVSKEDYYLDKIIALYPVTDNDTTKIDCFSAYINHLINKKDYDGAGLYLSKLDSLSRKINYPTGQIIFYGNSAYIEELKGHYREGIDLYYKAYCIALNDKKYAYAAQSLANAANTSQQQGYYDLAKQYSETGLKLARESKLDDYAWRFLDNMSLMAENEKRYKEALALRNECIDIYIKVHSDKNSNQINHYIARFESVLKENKIKELEHNTEMSSIKTQKKNILIVLLALTVGLSVIVFSTLILYRRRLAAKQKQVADQKIKELEKEKQLVATQAVLDGETAERTRLARDLHDGLGGMLSVVKLNLSDVKKGAVMAGSDVERFNRALSTLDESISELRRVAHNMMPDSLSRYGLKASLADFCNDIPTVRYQYFGSGDRLDPKLEMMIYHTVYELVNNAVKHAGAGKIIVQIVQEIDRIALTVQDDGCGFDIAAKTSGTGLNNIRNRVDSYNGHMEIWSKPDDGTEISIDLALPEKDAVTG